jgi:hypothetical protein
MSDTVYLVGSEDVRSAGHSIVHAAERIERAANILDESLRSHERFLDDWLARFRQAFAEKTGEG